MSHARFTVTLGGEVNMESESDPTTEPEPNDEDRRKARLLAEGGGFAKDVEDLFAQSIAVGRTGGDVETFLREKMAQTRRRPS